MDLDRRLENVTVVGAAGKMGSGIALLLAQEIARTRLKPENRDRVYKLNLIDIDRGAPNDRQTTFYTLEGRYHHPITRNFNIEGTVLYRCEDESVTGDDEGIEVDLAWKWNIRQREIRILCEFGKFRDDFADNQTSTLYVQVRRKFREDASAG